MRIAGKFTATVLAASIFLAGCGAQSETEKWQAAGEGALGQVQEDTPSDDNDYANNEYFIDQFIKLEKDDAKLERNHDAIQVIWDRYADQDFKINSFEQKKDLNQVIYSKNGENFNIEIVEIEGVLQKGTVNLSVNMTKENKYKYLTLSLFSMMKNISKYNLNKVVEEIYGLTDNKQSEYFFDGVNIRISKLFSDGQEHIQLSWHPAS